jgi:hypothetical protein
MIFAIINNLPELALGVCWSWFMFNRGRWWQRRQQQ